MRTLCILALHEYNLNVEFFIKHGLIEDPNVDFYFAVNDPDLQMTVPGVTVINRKNEGLDFGAWSEVLLTNNLYQRYDYFVLLNSTVRGPFLPVWADVKNWTELFIRKLNDQVKLVGTTVCTLTDHPHVQSMLLVTDRVGLQVGIDTGIFSMDFTCKNIIIEKEIGYSTEILKAGYNIACMLKALDGVDFRLKKTGYNGFFMERSYFGASVHPYEVIFPKQTLKGIGCAGNHMYTFDSLTNWMEGPEIRTFGPFNWVEYLLLNPELIGKINSKKEATEHYESRKFKENLVPGNTIHYPKYYKVDLNPFRTSGLVNQMYSLVNAALIGHYTDKHIIVEHFYPDYNKSDTVRLDKIIDLQRFNCLLCKLGLRTSVSPSIIPGDIGYVNGFVNSKYLNPTKETFETKGFIRTLQLLREERGLAINIGDTFSDFIFQRNEDPQIVDIFVKLITGITFTHPFRQVVDHIKETTPLKNYKAVHLRLEDDILPHVGSGRSAAYRKHISQHCQPSETIYLATHLTKSENRMNGAVDELRSQYPKTVILSDWRKDFPNFMKGRDIDAIIDYMICRDADLFIGWHPSTFSRILLYWFSCSKKPGVDVHEKSESFVPLQINDKVSTTPLKLVQPPRVKVLDSKVSHGKLGLNGDLGYSVTRKGETVNKVVHKETNALVISAHAPSEVVIQASNSVKIKGYCSPTAEKPVKMTFLCDSNKPVGEVKSPGGETDWLTIKPGRHILRVNTETPERAHSVWIVKSIR